MAQLKLANGLTRKQEAFAQGVASGLTASDAYRQAYDANGSNPDTINRDSHKYSSNPKIITRIAELDAEALAIAQLTRGNVAVKLAEDRLDAKADGQHAVALKATELQGDMIDAFGKRKIAITSQTLAIDVVLADMSIDELRKLMALGDSPAALGDGGG